MHFVHCLTHLKHTKANMVRKLMISQFFKFVEQIKQRDVTKFTVRVFLCQFIVLTQSHNFVGKMSGIKCKKEANAPTLLDFIKTLDLYAEYESERKNVRIVTDDASIVEEIKSVSQSNYSFMIPEPAPRRVLDKVFYHTNF